MKPFDLQAALAGEPIMYRDGTKPLEWHYFEKRQDERRLVSIDAFGALRTHVNDSGKWSSDNESPYDLFMVPKEKWVVLFRYDITGKQGIWSLFDTEAEAQEHAKAHLLNLIQVVKVDF